MRTPEAFLDKMNAEQRIAVENITGPMLIIAGAGSGKTRVITHRIAYMLQYCDIKPWNILAVTFTNKAAGEMRRRVIELIGEDPGPSLHISTFHSACARLLRREAYKLGLASSFTICDQSDQNAIIKDCMKTLDIDKTEIHPTTVAAIISQSKMRLLGAADFMSNAETERERMAGEIFQLYEKRLKENDALDFDDLLGYVVRLFEESPETLSEYQQRYRYILVDEYQDTNYVQYKLVECLAREHRNLCVVGDEDQSIYSWRGAEVSNLLDFQEQFSEARVIRLEQNYRSTQAILSVANEVIVNNTQRLGKNLWTGRAQGDKPRIMVAPTANDEAAMVVERILFHHSNGYPFRDMAIFYRANSLSRPFEDQLRKCNVPYRIVGGLRFYDRAEIKDLLAYLGLIHNSNNSIHLLRVINRPRRGLGEKSIQTLQAIADRYGVSCFQAIKVGMETQDLKGATAQKLTAFRDMIDGWRAKREQKVTLPELFEAVLADTETIDKLGDPDDFEVKMRIENIEEMRTVIQEFHSEHQTGDLADFLEMITLQSSVDEMGEDDAVSLMTFHSAKGLEFPVVFMVAVEEPIFPNTQSIEETGGFEEERRLFYVGVTRAQDYLYLSRADSRYRFGQNVYGTISRFLQEIPPALVDEFDETITPERINLFADVTPGRIPSRKRKPVERKSVFDKTQSSSNRSAYTRGDRVKHAVMGAGVVQEILRAQGGRIMLVIDFDNGESMAVADKATSLKKI